MAASFGSLGRNTQGALIAGVLSLVVSFFPYYIRASVSAGKDVPGFGFSAGTSAWHSYATLGMLLILVATALVAVKAFAGDSLPATVPWMLVALACAGVGTILIILRAFTAGGTSFGGVSVDVGPGWSGYLLFVTTIALSVFCYLAFKESGEKIPDLNRGGDTPSAA